jgi:phenylpyruvate tautomerase PptA (4-oxalocrotonate tautomerase family)
MYRSIRGELRELPVPTYTCWAEPGVVSSDARAKIAGALTEIHHDVAVAPRYFVQVVFVDLAADSLFVAGQAVPAGHVWIRADIRAGRTDEQKAELLRRIMEEIGGILGLPAEHVWVYICDIPGANIAEYGRVLPDPGEEDAWFAQLPPDLQERLTGLS